MKKIAMTSALALLQAALFASTGDVTLSGSTWTGKVDGVTKYTGSSMGAAVNACNSAMSSGTINIHNSGNTSTQIGLGSSKIVDGYGCTITGNAGNCIIHCQNSSSVGARNLHCAGSVSFGMYFLTDNGQSFSGVDGKSVGWIFRVDDCKGGLGYNFSCGSFTATPTQYAVETYGISGNSWSTINTSGGQAGCGVLLNYSSSASGGTVQASKCDYGGGYAGFRTANNNRSTTLTYDNATSCGRGFFSVSGSGGATLTRVNASYCSGIGIWLQSTFNTKVAGGTETSNGGGCSSISQDLGGNTVTVTCR